MVEPIDLESISQEIETLGWKQWFTNALIDAFVEARKKKLSTHDEHDFEIHWMENIHRLADSINEHYYEPSPSVSFVIFSPMVREIFAAPFRDRIVHHFLFNMQYGWWDRRFLHNSYSCRKDKGTLFGIQQAQKMMLRVTNNGHQDAYIIKLDISGYFMSLPRAKIYDRVRWGLDHQFFGYKEDPNLYHLYLVCDYLWRQIIFDDPVKKSWKRGSPRNWDPAVLPPKKSLYRQPPGRGIVIGNLTSQLVSNIYLDQLDQFVFHELGYKYYGRYVDDFFYMVPAKDYQKAKSDITRIETFLKDELELTLHPKKRYCSHVSHGMQFLGARIYPNCLYPSNRLQTNFYNMHEDLAGGYKDLESVISYLGIMKHMDANGFLKEAFTKFGWDYRPPHK